MLIEGETDLASMLWSRNEVGAVAALATVTWGDVRRPRGRARAEAPRAWRCRARSVMEGASAEALSACAGGFRGRVSESAGIGTMSGMVTCGSRCMDGVCERTLGSVGASTRMTWEASPRAGEGLCINVTGVGGETFNACRGEAADHARLVGQIPARGFDLVVAVERTLGSEGSRRPEVWTLVTRSARWHRLWTGAVASAESPRLVRVSMQGQHASLCRGDAEGAALRSASTRSRSAPRVTPASRPRSRPARCAGTDPSRLRGPARRRTGRPLLWSSRRTQLGCGAEISRFLNENTVGRLDIGRAALRLKRDVPGCESLVLEAHQLRTSLQHTVIWLPSATMGTRLS